LLGDTVAVGLSDGVLVGIVGVVGEVVGLEVASANTVGSNVLFPKRGLPVKAAPLLWAWTNRLMQATNRNWKNP